MIGTLYRYPHPLRTGSFVYVGQGEKRDVEHRSGRSSFGRRFRKVFPGVPLTQPIKETIEVCDRFELNDLETIWMFRYHTWKGYIDGMNLTFPGSKDYENLGKLGGPIGGQSNVVSGFMGELNQRLMKTKTGIFAPGNQARGGYASSNIHKQKGIGFYRFTAERRSQVARLGGEQHAKSGHIQSIGRKQLLSPGHQSRAGQVAGRNAKEKRLGIFAVGQNSSAGLVGGPKGMHSRWHLKRLKPNVRCRLCIEQNLVVAYA